MNEMIHRSLELDSIDIQRDDNEGRTLIGRALTYGVPYDVSDDGGRTRYQEIWRAGVFAKSIAQRAGRIPLMLLHDRRRLPIGATIGVDPSSEAFIFQAKISRTRDADEALELVRDGALTGISVGARPLNNRRLTSGVERVEAVLQELSLVPIGQMTDSGVLALRAEEVELEVPEVVDPVTTPHLNEAKAYLETLARP